MWLGGVWELLLLFLWEPLQMRIIRCFPVLGVRASPWRVKPSEHVIGDFSRSPNPLLIFHEYPSSLQVLET